MTRQPHSSATEANAITPQAILAWPVALLVCGLVAAAFMQLRISHGTQDDNAVTTIEQFNARVNDDGIEMSIPHVNLIESRVTEDLIEIVEDHYLDDLKQLASAHYWHRGLLEKRRIYIRIADFFELHIPVAGKDIYLYLDGKKPSKDRIHKQIRRILGLSKTYLALNFDTNTAKPQDLLMPELPDENFDFVVNNLARVVSLAKMHRFGQVRLTRDDYEDRHLGVIEFDVTDLTVMREFLENPPITH
mgnify:CR=1 FL=1